MGVSVCNSEQFAADVQFTTFAITQHASTGRDDRDAQTVERSGDVFDSTVDTATRFALPLERVEDGLTAWTVFQVDPNHSLSAILDGVKIVDVSFVLENLTDASVHLAVEAHDQFSVIPNGIAYSCQYVCDGVLK